MPDLETMYHHRHRGSQDADELFLPFSHEVTERAGDQGSPGLFELHLVGGLLVLLRLGPLLILGVLVLKAATT